MKSLLPWLPALCQGCEIDGAGPDSATAYDCGDSSAELPRLGVQARAWQQTPWTLTACRQRAMANVVALVLLLSAVMGMARADACRATNVDAGASFTCALLQDDNMRCWGDPSNGVLGRPNITTTSDPSGPPLDFGAGLSVVKLTGHLDFSCALLDDHTVSCWGSNDAGQLGLGDIQDRDQPTHVQFGAGNTTVQLLSTGSMPLHSCAVVTGEGVFCWGDAKGVGDFPYILELRGTPWLGQPMLENIIGRQFILPSKVDLGSDTGSPVTVIDMCGGHSHTCVLTVQLGLKCWGVAFDGQLGLGNITNTTGLTGANLPSVKLGTGRSAVQITCGAAHTCVTLDDGTLKCFGLNDHGQLGYGDTVSRGNSSTDMGDSLKPVDVGVGRTVKQVTAGDEHTCALLDNGQVKCWGDNTYGELGHHCNSGTWGGSPGQMGASLPAVDLGPGRTAVSISAGWEHSCAVLDDGSIKCWGPNSSGKLGINSSSSTNVCPPSLAVDLGTSCTSNTVGPANIMTASSPAPLSPGHSPAPTPTPVPEPSTSPARTQSSPPPPPPEATSPSPLSAPLLASSTQVPSTSTTTTSSSSHAASGGVVAGAVIGGVVVAALIGWGVWWWRNRRQRSPATEVTADGDSGKKAAAQLVIVASDEAAMEVAPRVGNVQSAADIKLDVQLGTMGAVISKPSTKADVQGASSSPTASSAAASPGMLRSTPPLTNTGSNKTDARDTSTSHAASAATPSSCGIVREGSVDNMRIPWSHITHGGLLGEGGFGKVYKAKWQMNNVAVKVLNMKKANSMAIENLHKEALIMSELIRHPCIARVFVECTEQAHDIQ